MNIQRPIGKPGKAQSLLAIRKGAAASTSSQTSRESKMLDPKSSQIVSVSTGRNPSETFKNQQLGLMANSMFSLIVKTINIF
jgi:hypothetical protein